MRDSGASIAGPGDAATQAMNGAVSRARRVQVALGYSIIVWHNDQFVEVEAVDAVAALGPDLLAVTAQFEQLARPYGPPTTPT